MEASAFELQENEKYNKQFNNIYDDEDTFNDGDEFEGELDFNHYE